MGISGEHVLFQEVLRCAGGQFPGAGAQNQLFWPNSSSGADFSAILTVPGAQFSKTQVRIKCAFAILSRYDGSGTGMTCGMCWGY